MSFECSTTSKIESTKPNKNALKSKESKSSWSKASVLNSEKMNKECTGIRIGYVCPLMQPYEKRSKL